MTISDELRERIRTQAGNRCGYCLSSQRYMPTILEIDHIVPQSLGGSDDEKNLWLACRTCNNYKAAQTHAIDLDTQQSVRLFNPRTQKWYEHFAWSDDGTIINGLTPCGRATVQALQLNNPISLIVRYEWVLVGWHPPKLDG